MTSTLKILLWFNALALVCVVALNLTATSTTRKVVAAKRVSENKYAKVRVRKMLYKLPEILT